MRADKARTELYGEHLDDWNRWMPIDHLMSIMQETSNNDMRYRGMHINQNPCDAWVYQEIISETQPNVIIEIGAGNGGSGLWLEDIIFSCVDEPGGVVSIDINPAKDDLNGSTFWVHGNSEDKNVISEVKKIIEDAKVMVIDDCAHTFDNVLANLKNYGPMVTKGCYYIVEDTLLNDKAPMRAIQEYLKSNDDFEIDRSREKFFITACPCGFLRKVK